MSRENVQLARQWTEAINRREPDAVVPWVHDDYELRNPWTPGGGTHRDVAAVRSFAAEFFDLWEVFSVEEQKIIEAGDAVVVLGQVRAEGKASGISLDGPIGWVHTVRGGRLAYTDVFLDHDSALKGVGLAK